MAGVATLHDCWGVNPNIAIHGITNVGLARLTPTDQLPADAAGAADATHRISLTHATLPRPMEVPCHETDILVDCKLTVHRRVDSNVITDAAGHPVQFSAGGNAVGFDPCAREERDVNRYRVSQRRSLV